MWYVTLVFSSLDMQHLTPNTVLSLFGTLLLIALSLQIYEFITQGKAKQMYQNVWNFFEIRRKDKAASSSKSSPPSSLDASTQLSRQRRSSLSQPVAATAVSERKPIRKRLAALRPRYRRRDEEKAISEK